MKKIEFLKDNGTISLVAPSFGATTEPYKTRLEYAIKNLEKLGYKIDKGENIFLAKGVVSSNTPKKRAKEFMNAYLSASDIIISVGGGELMNEMLPYIDFKKISKSPAKLFMGFSDNANLTFTLTTICDIPTIYGVNAPAFAFYPFENTTLDAYNLMTGKINKIKGYSLWEKDRIKSDNPLEKSNFTEKKVIKTYPKKDKVEIEGRLLGGNLDILSNLCGTKYDKTKEYIEKYKDDGIIWYLEACDLNPLSIRRALFTLKEAGWFKYAKGFLIGRPLCFGQKMFGVNHHSACTGVLKELNVPILMDIDLGHYDPTLPMFNGIKSKVDYKDNNIEIEYLFED